MPLAPGSSRQVVSQNIREFHTGPTFAHTVAKFGKKRANAQAIAVALNSARKSRADGGGVAGFDAGGFPLDKPATTSDLTPNERVVSGVAGYDAGGSVDPVQAVVGALQAGAGSSQGVLGIGGGSNPAAPDAAAASTQSTPATPSTSPASATAANSPTISNPGNSVGPVIARDPGIASTPATATPAPTPTVSPLPVSLLPGQGNGVAGRAMGGPAPAPWQERMEARNLTRGPILSSVPGRTDAHSTHVPSGSYVLPADIVSGRGQGNTIAGANNLSRMFKMGPYGSSPMAPPRGGMGIPKPPKLMAHSGGGKGGDRTGEPVAVNLAGGELVIPPENLMAVVHPNLKHAHAIMDAWVLHERKNLRKTLARLPGPVKS